MFLSTKKLIIANKESERLGKLNNYDIFLDNIKKIINKSLKNKKIKINFN